MVEKGQDTRRYISYRTETERGRLLNKIAPQVTTGRERSAIHGPWVSASIPEALHPTPKKIGS